MSVRHHISIVLCTSALFLAASITGSLERAYKDEVLVTCRRGLFPGQFYYSRGGDLIAPRCFGIDKDGNVYLPETWDGIRLHKFDSHGTLVQMYGLEGCAIDVDRIAVSRVGEIYLVSSPGYPADSVIIKYSSDGELMYYLGPDGVLPPEESEKQYLKGGQRKEYFHCISDMVELVEGDLLVVEGLGDLTRVYRFSRTGDLLSVDRDLPLAVRAELKLRDSLEETLRESDASMYRGLMGPDGRYYYMHYDSEKLTIHRVTFEPDGWTDPGVTEPEMG